MLTSAGHRVSTPIGTGLRGKTRSVRVRGGARLSDLAPARGRSSRDGRSGSELTRVHVEHALLRRNPNAQRKAVVTGPAMHVQAIRAKTPEAVVG